MFAPGITGYLLVLVNLLVSFYAFQRPDFFRRYDLQVSAVLGRREYYRTITSGFLHVSWPHLILNLLSLSAFSGVLELFVGPLAVLLIYFAGLIGGNALALALHRLERGYRAAGASGAVCGLIFATIALAPSIGVGFFGLFSLPGWLYGLLFVAFSIWGIRARIGNIGHDAHLAGAVMGMLVALALVPAALAENYPAVLAILLPSLGFIWLLVARPATLQTSGFGRNRRYANIDDRYRAERKAKQELVDALLEKIHRRGIQSLTKKERELLEEHSRSVS